MGLALLRLQGLMLRTGVVMLLYLELAYERWKKEGKLNSIADLKEAVMYGAVKRIRPKIMTVSVYLQAYPDNVQPRNRRRDVMKRIAAPMVYGVITSTILELVSNT